MYPFNVGLNLRLFRIHGDYPPLRFCLVVGSYSANLHSPLRLLWLGTFCNSNRRGVFGPWCDRSKQRLSLTSR
jgi:hypothetical protein